MKLELNLKNVVQEGSMVGSILWLYWSSLEFKRSSMWNDRKIPKFKMKNIGIFFFTK